MLNLNDLVTVKPAYRGKYKGVFRVTAVPGGARKKHLIQSVSSELRVNAYEYMLEAFTGDIDDAAEIAGPPAVGSFVTIKNPKINPERIYIVVGTSKSGARVVNPGGGGGYRNVSFSSMTILDASSVCKPLAVI